MDEDVQTGELLEVVKAKRKLKRFQKGLESEETEISGTKLKKIEKENILMEQNKDADILHTDNESIPCDPLEEKCSEAQLKNAIFYEGEVKQSQSKEKGTKSGDTEIVKKARKKAKEPIPETMTLKQMEMSDELEPASLKSEILSKPQQSLLEVFQKCTDKEAEEGTIGEKEPSAQALLASKHKESEEQQTSVNSVPAFETKQRKSENKVVQTFRKDSSSSSEENLTDTSERLNLRTPIVEPHHAITAKAKLKRIEKDDDSLRGKEDKRKEEKAPIFANLKLKKTEVVKRKIETPSMETVQLIHHEFENVPLDHDLEQYACVLLNSEPLPYIEENLEIMESGKNKGKKKPLKTKKLIGDIKESSQVKPSPSITQEKQPEENIAANPKKKSVDSDKTIKPKKSPPIPEGGSFSTIKLKKSETIKRSFSPPQVEKVQLVHHDFENVPQEPYAEAHTGVIIRSDPKNEGKLDTKSLSLKKKQIVKKVKRPSSPSSEVETVTDLPTEVKDEVRTAEPPLSLIQIEQNKNKEKGKTLAERPLQVLKAQEYQHEIQPEEVTRKPKDPILPHAAAMEKKHSDTERINLPTFVNFPSEQGVAIIPQEGILEPNKQTSYEEISETFEEDNFLPHDILETKPLVKALGKKKVLPKDQTPGSPVISSSIQISTVTSETVTAIEVFPLVKPFLQFLLPGMICKWGHCRMEGIYNLVS